MDSEQQRSAALVDEQQRSALVDESQRSALVDEQQRSALANESQRSEQQWEEVERSAESEEKFDWESLETNVTIGIETNILNDIYEQQPENTICFDCQSDAPQMASVNNGIFICVNCAAIHSAYKIEEQKIKNIKLDSWTEVEVRMMQLGGNKNLYEVFRSYGLNDESSEDRLGSEAAAYYKRKLLARVQGQILEERAPNLHSGRKEPVIKGPTLIAKGVGKVTTAAVAVKKGSDAIGLTEEIVEVKDNVKKRAEELKVSQRATAAGQTVKRGAQTAGSTVKKGATIAAAFTKQKTTRIGQMLFKKKSSSGESEKKDSQAPYVKKNSYTESEKKDGHNPYLVQNQMSSSSQSRKPDNPFVVISKEESKQEEEDPFVIVEETKESKEPKEPREPVQSQFSKDAQAEPSFAEHNPYADYL